MSMSPDAERVRELEVAIVTALKLNTSLHEAIESQVASYTSIQAERDAWMHKSSILTNMINGLRKMPDLNLQPLELSLEESMRKMIEWAADRDATSLASFHVQQQAEAEAASRAPLSLAPVFTLSVKQEEAIASLLLRGHAAGWLVHPSHVTLGRELGSGSFGTTYQAVYRGSDVACKCVRISKPSELTSFLREIETLSLLKSPHVVPFIGASIQAPDSFYLLTELMSGGTLDRWLHEKPQQSGVAMRRSLTDRANMCLDIAKGMVAMHACSPPVYHRDLKPSNVLIDGGGRARIADMGFSRRLLPSESRAQLTGETGTYLYMAPEMMRHEVYDESADVWSWGILFSEVMNGSGPPYHHLFLTPVQIGLAVAQEELAPTYPDHLPVEMQVLGRMATQFDPRARPSFASIVTDLSRAVDLLTEEQRGKNDPSSSVVTTTGAQGLADLVASFTQSWTSVMARTIYKQPGNEGEATAAGVGSRPASARGRPSVAEVEAKVRALALSRATEGRREAELLDSAYAIAARVKGSEMNQSQD